MEQSRESKYRKIKKINKYIMVKPINLSLHLESKRKSKTGIALGQPQ